MGVDTDVLLRVRDRGALREALEAHAVADRKGWADQGREAEYDELIAGGHDPRPLLRPLEDGSVSIFTGLRFHDGDMEYSIRCWLHAYFGDALARIHDDPRGVFVSPDVCEPRAKTYDGVIAELKEAGRFIDPSPPTQEEEDARRKAFDDYLKAMEACTKAKEAGDELGFRRALAAAPEEVRQSWAAQEDMARRMAEHERQQAAMQESAADGESAREPASARVRVVEPQTLDPSVAMGMMRQLLGLPDDASPDAMGAMLAQMMERDTAAMRADPLGFGRVSMLLPAAAATALGANLPPHLDVQERRDLADGSVILVTSRMGDAEMDSTTVAAALAEAGFDRAAVGAVPFFRESLVDGAASAATFEDAKRALGDRASLLELRTFEEMMQDERKSVSAWLEES